LQFLKILNVRTENAIARIVRQRVEDAKRAAKARGPKSLSHDSGNCIFRPYIENLELFVQIALQVPVGFLRLDTGADEPLDLFKLQPKKPNWDLKRDLDEKLKILTLHAHFLSLFVSVRLRSPCLRSTLRILYPLSHDSGNCIFRPYIENLELFVQIALQVEGETLVEGIHMREREEEKSDEETI
jgi:hypothetical protein